MKKTLEHLFHTVHENVSDVPFRVQFWDGDSIDFGSGQSLFTLIFKTERSARRIFSEGSLGFGEEYVAGNIIVEGDFKELMRLGTEPSIQDMKLPLKTKLTLLIKHLQITQYDKEVHRKTSRIITTEEMIFIGCILMRA